MQQLHFKELLGFRVQNRSFRGVGTVCPSPVTQSLASFRLRFRFVRVERAVRAGEAKLYGRMTSDVLIPGPPGCEYPSFFCGFSHHMCCYLHGFNLFLMSLLALGSFFNIISMSFKELPFFVRQNIVLWSDL